MNLHKVVIAPAGQGTWLGVDLFPLRSVRAQAAAVCLNCDSAVER